MAAGLIALQIASTTQPNLKLIVEADDEDCYLDVEYAIVDGRPRQVLGSPRWWAWQDRVGEKEALGVWVKQDRYRIARGLVGGLPTQAEMDLLTDFVQWLGTPVGCCFMASIQSEIDAALLTKTNATNQRNSL